MTRVYDARQEKDRRAIRHGITRAVAYDLSWLGNRGVYSIAGYGFLGETISNALKRIVPNHKRSFGSDIERPIYRK